MSSEDTPLRADDAPVSDTPVDETPLQRALREKQARLAARAKPPRGGRFQREQAARVKNGKARPWLTL